MRRIHPLNRRPAAMDTALFVVLAAGCSNYTGRSQAIRVALVKDDYAGAMQTAKKIEGGSSELLYYYETGLILHYFGHYDSSNVVFNQAEILLEDLYTKSVTREMAALAVTDQIAKYRGDPYEAILVDYYQILNYLHLGDLDGALVECRQVNNKLQMIFDADENYFQDDPFLQYITAMLYELRGDRTDAEVSYRVAVEAYEGLADAYAIGVPPSLYCDAAANALRLGDFEEARMFSEERDCAPVEETAGTGRLNIFVECGFVASKVERNIVLPIFENDRWDNDAEFAVTLSSRYGHTYTNRKVAYWLRVALPDLVAMPVRYNSAVIRALPAGASANTSALASSHVSLVENVDTFARAAFEEKQGKVLVRAITRALIKYAASNAADKKDSALGALVNILGVATESADTRSWSTLPQRIFLGRLDLPPGTYDLHIDLIGPAGSPTGSLVVRALEVREGRTEFLSYRIF